MPERIPLLKPAQVIRALEGCGFTYKSQKGSHRKYERRGRVVIVPMSDIIARGTLRSILEQSGLTLDELLSKL